MVSDQYIKFPIDLELMHQNCERSKKIIDRLILKKNGKETAYI